ncbi:fructose-bisphosphate aldolase, class II [Candidatus Methanomarinus sp.]|nr:fructose-bisphosphate aldolase, class II [ANME-2 cluster archaeon]
MVWDIFKVYEPELYNDIWNWTLDTYRDSAQGKADNEIFGKYCKFAIKQFFDRIYSVHDDTIKIIDTLAYAETLIFLKAFKAEGTAQIVRNAMG